jgi:addiction module HigA family antidote
MRPLNKMPMAPARTHKRAICRTSKPLTTISRIEVNWRHAPKCDPRPLKQANTMEVKNPPRPGELIGDSLEQLGMAICAAAKCLGITHQQLHNLIAGRRGVTPEMAVRFEKALGSTIDVKRFAPKVA